MWKGADAVVVPVGKANEDEPEFTKSKAVHRYLLQYEFQDTVMVFSSAGLHVLSAAKKVGFLTPLAAEAKKVGVNVTLLTRNKVDANKANFAAMVGAIKGSHGGAKVAGFLKEKASQTGAVCAGWAAAAAAAAVGRLPQCVVGRELPLHRLGRWRRRLGRGSCGNMRTG